MLKDERFEDEAVGAASWAPPNGVPVLECEGGVTVAAGAAGAEEAEMLELLVKDENGFT